MSFSGTRIASGYFLVQGLAILVWWGTLGAFPEARRFFLPDGASEVDLLAFSLPDLVLSAPGSLITGLALLYGARWAVGAAWFTTGAMGYSLLYCIAWSALRGGGWVNVLLMAPAALLSAVCAVDVSASFAVIFRRAAAGSATRHLMVTFVQIACFWWFFLFAVPTLLVLLERGLGSEPFEVAGQVVVGWVLLSGFSALGLWSGIAIAARGAGTPLPFDATNRLVIDGPYAYVRNPMVIAGLGQGVSVGLLFGSWVVFAYVSLGAGIWQWIVRPAEERDLLAVFGDSYASYVRHVKCWIPRRQEYRGLPAPVTEI
jgi:protein-S-isoprenylcysteine O-methyltransferase Ste14